MRTCNFLVKEAIAVHRALVSQAWADYRSGLETLEDTLLDLHAIKQRDHSARVEMLRQRGIALPDVSYRGVA